MPEDAPLNGGVPAGRAVGPLSRVSDPATLLVAFARVAGNRGANTPGVDGWTVAAVEERVGMPGFLDGLRASIKEGTLRPLPVRERRIPKPGGSGKVRKLGIPRSLTGWSRRR